MYETTFIYYLILVQHLIISITHKGYLVDNVSGILFAYVHVDCAWCLNKYINNKLMLRTSHTTKKTTDILNQPIIAFIRARTIQYFVVRFSNYRDSIFKPPRIGHNVM